VYGVCGALLWTLTPFTVWDGKVFTTVDFHLCKMAACGRGRAMNGNKALKLTRQKEVTDKFGIELLPCSQLNEGQQTRVVNVLVKP